jgi:hypothetical protein
VADVTDRRPETTFSMDDSNPPKRMRATSVDPRTRVEIDTEAAVLRFEGIEITFERLRELLRADAEQDRGPEAA